MTEKQQYIVRIVMDDTTLRKLAWYKWTSLQAVQEEIFIKLADNMVVHSELNLNYDWQNSMPLLKRAMEENHIAFTEESDLVNISLNNIHLKAMVPGNGSVSLIMNKGMVNLHFSAHSIVKLIRFIDDVFPDVELKVKQKALELFRNLNVMNLHCLSQDAPSDVKWTRWGLSTTLLKPNMSWRLMFCFLRTAGSTSP